MSSDNTTFKGIPVVTSGKPRPGQRLEWIRIATRLGAIAAMILIPVLGIFRINLSSGFVVFDYQIWFGDFFIVFGFWLSIACLLIIAYSSFGAIFCGWACPQNTVSTWANKVTSKLLGKRAIIDWGDETSGAHVSSGKNKIVNWIWLAAKLLAMSMTVAVIPLLYFLPPDAIISFITLQPDERITGSLYWIYFVFSFIALVNIAVMRHYVCRYMCIYRIWQFLFKTRDTLHIAYDASRSSECTKCNYCATVCPVDINPRDTLTYDSCINCGECITACDKLPKNRETGGLLSFKLGKRTDKEVVLNRVTLTTLFSRTTWVFPVFALAVGIFTWGVVNYEPVHMSAYRADIIHGDRIQDYRIHVAHKVARSEEVSIRVSGLPADAYELDTTRVAFSGATRENINLNIHDNLAPGLYAIDVHAEAASGWQGSYRLHHFVHN